MIRLLVLLGVLAAGAAAAQTPLVERDTVEVNPAPGVSVRRVDIDNRLGDVTVVGEERATISIAVVKRAADAATLERVKVGLVPDPAGVVTLGTQLVLGSGARPLPTGLARVDVTVLVPRGVEVKVYGWSGALSVSSLDAAVSIVGEAATIAVHDVDGAVVTANTRGKQRLEAVRGSVLASNTFGELTLVAIDGDEILARAHEGAIVARDVRARRVTLTSTRASILFEGSVAPGGRLEARSLSGAVVVRLSGGSASVDAFSRDGAVEPELELLDASRPSPGRLLGRVGGGATPAVLELSSTMGTVRFGLVSP